MSPAAEPSSSSSPQAPSASPDAPTHTPPADALARAPSLTSPQDNPADESALVDEPVQAGPLVEQTSAPVQPVDEEEVEARPPHCAFSPWTRRFIIFTASSVSIFSSLSSNIFVPAVSALFVALLVKFSPADRARWSPRSCLWSLRPSTRPSRKSIFR